MIHLHFSIPAIWLIYSGGVVMFVINRPEFKYFVMLADCLTRIYDISYI